MHIEYEIIEDDFLAAYKLARKTLQSSFHVWYWRVIGALLIGTAIAITLESQRWLLEAVIVAIGFLVIGAADGSHGSHAHLRKNKALRGRRTLDITDEVLHFKAQGLDARVDYSLYSKFGEDSRTFVLIQQGDSSFTTIPKRELTSLEIDELRALFQAHIPIK